VQIGTAVRVPSFTRTMEFLVAGVIAGVLLALALARVIWVVISQAVDNLLAWAVYTFGNDEAVKQQKEADDRRDP